MNLFKRGAWAVILLSLLCITQPGHSGSRVAVITNASVDSQELTLMELRAIFTMKRRLWTDGREITVYVLKEDDDAHAEFSKRVLGVLPRQLQAIWQRLTFSGTGNAPVELNSQEEMLRFVEETPGAIGYLFSENSNDKVNEISVLK